VDLWCAWRLTTRTYLKTRRFEAEAPPESTPHVQRVPI